MERDGNFQGGNSPNFSSCWILTESQEFIRRTFSFLPAKTLGICSGVCKAWYAEVKRVLHHREEIGWATFGRIEAEEVSHGNEDQLGPFGAHLNACLKTLGSLPRHAIVFSECLSLDEFQEGTDFGREEANSSGTRKTLQKSLEAVRSKLPVESSVVFVHSDGTMGCKPDLSPAGETEGSWGTACVLLPNMDGVTVECQRHYRNKLTRSEMEAYVARHGMPADTKCVLVFSSGGPQRGGRFLELLQHGFQEEFGTMPVIAGGIARNVGMVDQTRTNETGTNSKKLPSCLTVTFSGPNVRAASVVLDNSVTARDKARSKFQELKKLGLPGKHSLAFLFSCVGRGRHFYQAEDVESGAFHEVFPDTPLVGFFGGGEYGCDNFTLGRSVQESADRDSADLRHRNALKKLQNLEKSFTCVVCLLSFG
ncbi:F-box only protein 22-like isoform X2 [Patiria miniata]|nr:F-box only protein 22-like isoform X2 [Patiria miniata]